MEQDGALDRVSTVDALSDTLRRGILDGTLRPGQPLREVLVATRYQVGRNSVRAAFQVLAHQGLLRRAPHRGVFVSEYSLADIADLFTMRAAVETEAARLVVAGRLDTFGVEAALQELEAVTDDTAWNEVIALDMAVHQEIIRATGSSRMERAFDGLVLEMRLLQAQVHTDYPQPGESLGAQHRTLLEACQGDDVEAAAAAVREHLRMSQLEVNRALARP